MAVSRLALVERHGNPFDNIPDGQLADMLGEVKAEIATFEEREQALRAEILARGIVRADGQLFRAVVARSVQWRIDPEKARNALGDAYTSCCKAISITSVRVSAR